MQSLLRLENHANESAQTEDKQVSVFLWSVSHGRGWRPPADHGMLVDGERQFLGYTELRDQRAESLLEVGLSFGTCGAVPVGSDTETELRVRWPVNRFLLTCVNQLRSSRSS